MNYKYFLLVSACFTNTISKENHRPTTAEKDFEKNVIEAYGAACERLQDLTDWMSVVLEAKGLWTGSLSRSGRFLFTGVRNRAKRDAGDEISCASLRNLQRSKEVYILGQATLIRILADLGGEIIKAGKSRLETSTNTLKILQERLKSTELFDEVSGPLLKAVSVGSKRLIQQVQRDSERVTTTLKDLGINDGALRFFQARKSEIVQQLQKGIEEHRSALQQTQPLYGSEAPTKET